ncbi:MAG: S8 family peptidase [Chitinophagales bacterium]
MQLQNWSAKAFILSGLILSNTITGLFASGQNETLYWYEAGKAVEWKVDHSKQFFKLHENYFKEAATAKTYIPFEYVAQNIVSIDQYSSSESVEHYINSGLMSPVTAIYSEGLKEKTLYLDDILLLQLRDLESTKAIEYLQNRYNIELLKAHENSYNTVLFKNLNTNEYINSALLSAKIYEAENAIVKEVQPNRINLFEPLGAANDVDIEKSWFIENSGQAVSCGSYQQEATTDAAIGQAWDNGATGKNTKVAVIDFFGFDYDHPDMQGQMLGGWDCIKNKTYDASNFYFTSSSQAHGMAVAGVIAAKANNGVGSAGVAYDSKVIPMLIDGSEASVVLALQKAISSGFDADVINCSFGSYFPSPAIKNEIDNAINHGRNGKGTFIVASHGNDYYDDINNPQYPSSYDEVISVGASTPDDLRKTPNDGWDVSGSWGTNYGDKMHISAPGVCIFTTDLSGGNGYGSSDYISFHKTSAAAPIVSGVIALMLGQDNTKQYSEVVSELLNTADKVNAGDGGAKYNYYYNEDEQGRSRETGYGRVNALKAVGGTPVGIGNTMDADELGISMNTLVQDKLQINLSNQNTNIEIHTRIVDLSGKTVYFQALIESMEIDANSWATGMYLVHFIIENQAIETRKIVKSSY